MVRVLGRGLLDERKERRGHFLAVDDEGAAEYLVATVLGVDLREAEDFAIGQPAPQLLLHAVQIVYFLGREGQSLGLVIGFEVVNMADGLGGYIDAKKVLPQPVVTALEHWVDRGIGAEGEVFFNAANAVEMHVLRNLHGISAPRRHHLFSRPDIASFERRQRRQCGAAIEPAQLVSLLGSETMGALGGYHRALRCEEKENHNDLRLVGVKLVCEVTQPAPIMQAHSHIYLSHPGAARPGRDAHKLHSAIEKCDYAISKFHNAI